MGKNGTWWPRKLERTVGREGRSRGVEKVSDLRAGGDKAAANLPFPIRKSRKLCC